MRHDTQRSKVYKAELSIRNKTGLAKRLETIPEIQKYVDAVCKRKRVQDRYRQAVHGIKVNPRRSGSAACGGYGKISIPPGWARQEFVVLHEVAHCLAGAEAWHEWRFCECFLFLVRQVMGREAHDLLKAAYKKHRVQISEPRPKRTVSPERRAELAERLAANRPAYTRGTFVIERAWENEQAERPPMWAKRTSTALGAAYYMTTSLQEATVWTTKEGVERFMVNTKMIPRLWRVVDLNAKPLQTKEIGVPS